MLEHDRVGKADNRSESRVRQLTDNNKDAKSVLAQHRQGISRSNLDKNPGAKLVTSPSEQTESPELLAQPAEIGRYSQARSATGPLSDTMSVKFGTGLSYREGRRYASEAQQGLVKKKNRGKAGKNFFFGNCAGFPAATRRTQIGPIFQNAFPPVLKSVLMAALLIALTALRLGAAKHPALDPKVEAAKCVECHADKTKGKSVHSAMASGCLSCHEVRVSKDITRVKLTTATPVALCLTCHADKKAADIKGKVHPPAVRDCLKCHDPHASDNKNQLLKPTSGETKQENLCLSCHNKGMDVPKGGSRHAALDMGCDACHVTHKTGDPAQREFAYHLAKDAPALCLDCHDVKDAAIIKAHRNQPFAKADCLQCHDPHQSKAPKLMQAFLHNPFEGKECDTCHEAPKDGKVVLTQKNVKSLCVMCHEDVTKQIAAAKVQHPGAAGDCTDCHNPHAGKSPGFLQPSPVAACLVCHSDQAEQFKKKHLHQPAFEQGCATCHEPHGGDNAHLLRARSVNALCLECHGPDANPQKLASDHMVTIFRGKVKLAENYFSKVPILPLKYGLGHPTPNHPVADAMIPKTKAVFAMNCLTCHQPHSGNEAGMLAKDQKNDLNFCRTCHANGLDLTDVRMGGK